MIFVLVDKISLMVLNLNHSDESEGRMKLILLSFVLTCVSAGVTQTPTRCVWGPTFWCSTLEHARECNATKHCLDTVWKYQILKPDSSDNCALCHMVIGELKRLLSDKPTEDEITNVAARACGFLSDPDWQDQCRGIILEYTPELLKLLDKDIDAQMICATVGLCSGLEDRVSPYGVKATTQAPATTSNTTCEDCIRFFTDVQRSITSNETVDSLMQLFNQTLCSHLGSFEDLCMELLRENLPIALQLLAKELDPNIECRVFGFCGVDLAHPPPLQLKLRNTGIFKDSRKGPLQYRSSEECNACKEVMNQLVDVIRDRTNQEEIENLVETDICEALGGLKDTCKQLVEQYGPMFFELLANELDPETFCETVGMCPVPTLYDIKPIVLDRASSEKPKPKVAAGSVQGSELCELCEFVVKEIDDVLKLNDTVKTVEEVIEKVCKALPTEDLEQQCINYVKTYGPLLLYLLAQDLDPKVVCTTLKVCQASSSEEKKEMDDTVCVVCVDIVKQVELLLQNMTTEEVIGDALAVCAYVPVQEYQQMCKDYVQKYGPLVVGFLKSGMDPLSVCQLAGACNKTVAWAKMTKPIPEKLDPSPVKAGPSTVCEVCDTLVVVAKDLLANKASEDEILQALNSECSVLGSFADECKSLVDIYGKKIYELLVKDLEPGLICGELGLCPSDKQPGNSLPSVVLSPLNTLPLEEAEKSTAVSCEVCTVVIETLKEIIGNKVTVDGVTSALEGLCNKLPPNMQGQCMEMLVKYMPELIQYAVQDLSTVCKKLGLCSGLQETLQQTGMILSPYDTLPLVGLEEKKDEAVPNSIKCMACEFVMKKVIEYVGEDKTEAKIQEALDKVCADAPAMLSQECKSLVDTYTKEIINYVLMNLGADEICKKLELCTTAVPLKPLPKPVHVKLLKDIHDEAVPNSIKCMACEFVMKKVIEYVGEDKTEAKIQEALDKVCADAPAMLSQECKSLVDTYTKEIINYVLMNLGADEICKKLELCPTAVPLKPLPKPVHVKLLKDNHAAPGRLADGPFCTVCKLIMKKMEDELKENKTEEAVRDFLEKICTDLPSGLQDQCKSFVDEYTDMVVKLFVQNVSPDAICKAIHVCTALSVGSWKAEVKLLPAGMVEPSGANKAPKAGPFCTICEFVIKELKDMLKENSSEAAVKKAIEEVCSKMPSTISGECKSFVDQYANLVYQLLIQEVDAEKICTLIGACTSGANIAPKAGPLCPICEFIMTELKDMLKENSSEAEIKKAVEEVCSFLPTTIRTECSSFVKQYGPLIINLLQQAINPQEICTKITLCMQAQQTSLKNIKGKVSLKGNVECVVCEFVIERVEEIVAENRTEAAMKEALDKVCSLLPSTISKECNELVNKYSNLIIHFLVTEVDPTVICTLIGACGTDMKTLALLQAKSKPVQFPGKGDVTCEACQMVCQSIEAYLHQNKSKQELEQLLDQLCDLLPDTVTAQCRIVVKNYGPQILSDLEKDMDPKLFCSALQLCDQKTNSKPDDTLYFRPSSRQNMLGTSKCTYGPAFWCASKENAINCNAVEHCKRHVWN